MKEKIYHNPNIDLYDIDFDINNRWEELFDEADEGKFDSDKFFDVLKDTHRFIKKYDNSKMIPRSALVLQNILHWFKTSDYYIEDSREFFCATEIAGVECQLLTDGLSKDDSERLYDIEDDICRRWDILFEEIVEEGSFDYDAFRNLAADTYSFIEKYDKEIMIPRSALTLLTILNSFSISAFVNCEGCKKALIAREIADEFGEQMRTGLIYETDERQRRLFVVHAEKTYHVDALNFDLTDVEQERPDWIDDVPF